MALPLMFAARTLAQLKEADWETRAAGVKITRGQVKAVMARVGIAVLKKDGVRKLYQELSASG